MRFGSAKQAWTDVHEAFFLSPAWERFSEPLGAERCYHCPFCRQPGFMRELVGDKAVVVDGQAYGWRCGSCGELAQRPLMLKRRGRVSATQTRAARAGAADWRIVDGLHAARVLAVIERLPGHCYAWGRWVYTDGQARERAGWGATVAAWMMQALDDADAPQPRNRGEWLAEERMLVMLQTDARQREMNGRQLYSQADVARALGVDRRYLDRRYAWGQRYQVAVAALARLNAEVLEPVQAVVDDLRAEYAMGAA